MTFDYTLRREGSALSLAFTVEAADREAADFVLALRLLRGGYDVRDLLYLRLVAVVERGRRP